MNLTTAMIVRNEAGYLEECLRSIQSVSDQIVIVDTGSTDSTLEIARKYKADIYHFDWVDDFAAARNESLKYAKGNWVLCIDADERLEPESVEELKKIIKSSDKSSYFRVSIRNQTGEKNHYNITSTHRLFPNFMGIEFTGRIHEQILTSAREKGLQEKNSTITLYHLGYLNYSDPYSSKSKRNYKLLKKSLGEHPKNAYNHFTFAQHLDLTGNLNEALKHYTTALNLNQFGQSERAILLNAIANTLIKLKKYSEAQRYCRQSIRLAREQVSAYYQLYKIGMLSDDQSVAIDGLRALIDAGFLEKDFRTLLYSDLQIDRQIVIFTLANLLLKNGRLSEALECYSEVPDYFSLNEKNYRQAINIALKLNNLKLAIIYLEDLNNRFGLPLADTKIQAMLYIKEKKYPEAINVLKDILQQEPKNQDIIRKLAALYSATGQSGAAAELIARTM